MNAQGLSVAATVLCVGAAAARADIPVKFIAGGVANADPTAQYWKSVPETVVTLTAQPMETPRPATTTTPNVTVQAVHDGVWMALRLRWKDPDKSEAGRLGEYSDAAALQFPIKDGPVPPFFMGAKDAPVHIYHWRAQYQRDRLKGKPTMKDLYPNMAVDMYPMEFADHGNLGRFTEEDRERFSPGRMAGNPQAYTKTGVDEIYAEGFSTSSVQEGHQSAADGRWENGEWTLVIARKLDAEGGSHLRPGTQGWVAFAVWQGGQGEVGSRKCVTMMWTGLALEHAKEAGK